MRGRWTATGAAALAWTLLAGSGAAAPEARPDVLLVTVDSLRADRLGAYGFRLDTSPHIDRLAAEGLLFERAVAASSASAPSLASILTSRFVREHGVVSDEAAARPADLRTLAEVFREAGYRTGAVVAGPALRRPFRFDPGFDAGFDHYDDEPSPAAERGGRRERTADRTTARAVAWLEADAAAPRFLWVHYRDPHGPYAPPPRARGRFRVRGDPEQRELPVLDDDTGYGGIPAYQALPGLAYPSEYESRYADEIRFTDLWIGRLLAAAGAGGRDPVVLLTADHGESLGEDDRWFVHGHSTTPETARVPLLLRAPGVAPARVPGLVHHVDVMPTLLGLAGLAAPPGARGLSLVDALARGALPERVVYCDIGREVSAYDAGGFVRLLGADAVSEDGRDPLWVRFRWLPGAGWSRQPSGGDLDPRIRRYLRAAPPAGAASFDRFGAEN